MCIDSEQKAFAQYILDLGNWNLFKKEFNEIKLPKDTISSGNLTEEIFRVSGKSKFRFNEETRYFAFAQQR